MEDYLLDTNIISYWLKEKSEKHQHVLAHAREAPKSHLWMSVVSLGEIHYGMARKADDQAAKEYVDQVTARIPRVLEIDRHTAIRYGTIREQLFAKYSPRTKRKRTKWTEELEDPTTEKVLGFQENDLWIAAQAIEHNFVLVTNDPMRPIMKVVKELRTENWAEPHRD